MFYRARITDADVLVPDGKSLEYSGATPDELIRPSAEEIAANRDPVLARAAELLGVKLDAAAAGMMFQIEWK